MQVKTRKQAILDGDNTYFTSKPCIKGHTSYRYTQSGTCYQCLHPTIIIPESIQNERIEAAKRQIEIKDSLSILKIRIFPSERPGVAAMAYALAAMRFPGINVSDIDPKLAPTNSETSGTSIYKFYCYPDDVSTLTGFAAATFKKYPIDVEQQRVKVLAFGQSELAQDTTPPMNFK